jgi:hypothetical protein
MAADVDLSGVLLQQNPAAVELGTRNTVRASGDHGGSYLTGVHTVVGCR